MSFYKRSRPWRTSVLAYLVEKLMLGIIYSELCRGEDIRL